MLSLLPVLGLSFGPTDLPIVVFVMARILLTALAILLTGPAIVLSLPLLAGRLLAVAVLLQVALSICAFYGLYIEPFNLKVTELKLPAAQFYPERPLRILQISDLHVEYTSPREREVIERVTQLQPDLIVLTGDYLNLDYTTDPETIAQARLVLEQLHAPLGVYAVKGSVPVDTPEVMRQLFAGTSIRVLDGETQRIRLPLGDLYLLGVPVAPGDAGTLKQLAAGLSQGGYKVLLYHTPDLIETASALGIDLYLAGHTHGGQIRLPFYGAVFTSSRYGKRYESGEYRVGETLLYVSRGVGMEGGHMPRIRFLAPPELVLVECGR